MTTVAEAQLRHRKGRRGVTFLRRCALGTLALGSGLVGACTGSSEPGTSPLAGTGGTVVSAGTGGSATSATGGRGGQPGATGGQPGATGGQPGATGGQAPGSGGTPAGGATAQAGAATGGSAVGPLPASCAEAAAPYTLQAQSLDPSLVPFTAASGFNDALYARLPLAVGADNRVYVGFTRAAGGSFDAVIAEPGGATIAVPGAFNGGIAATRDGLAVLLFEPLSNVDERKWAAVRRLKADGSELFQTDLFRSANLEDEGTKGAPSTSRLGYIAETDLVVAYFAHTQRYDDEVRHQGGYLATLDANGEQQLLSGWFGSHNLDQRLFVDQNSAAVVGLGDAYPEGIFFGRVEPRAQPVVLVALASAGNGATNGQLGGVADVGNELVLPFVTNRSIPEDLDAGTWPDIDETIADQIRDAAANGTDIGILRTPKAGTVPSPSEPLWLDVEPAAGARIERLKAVAYGDGGLVLLAWAELTGSGRAASTRFYSLVTDADGSVCQARTEISAENAFMAGDDIVRRPDGALVWANVTDDVIRVITLIPG